MSSAILVLSIVPALAFSQVRVTMYTGVTYPSLAFSSDQHRFPAFLRDNWHPGINLGVGAQFALLDWLEVCPQVEYSHYVFDYFEVHTPGGPPMFQSASGQPSRVVRFKAEGRAIKRTPRGATSTSQQGLRTALKSSLGLI